MASAEPKNVCVACGSDISTAKGRRLLCTEASNGVKVFWSELFDEELSRRGMSPQAAFLINNSGRICRRCFTVYERCKKLLDSLKQDLCKAVDIFERENTFIPTLDSSNRASNYSALPPAPKRRAIATSSSASPTVVTHVYYKQPKSYVLTLTRKKLGKAVARRSNMVLAAECLKIPKVKNYIISKIGKLIRVELCKLCLQQSTSTLRDHSKSVLTGFSWDTLEVELLSTAPVLLSILRACTETKKPRNNRTAVIGMCAALILRHRFTGMSLIQKMISLILYAGSSEKQVFERLQKLNICMSYRTTIRLVNALGMDYDAVVCKWRDSLVPGLENLTSVNELALQNNLNCPDVSDSSTYSSSDTSDGDISGFSYDSCSIVAPSCSPLTSDFNISDCEQTDGELSISGNALVADSVDVNVATQIAACVSTELEVDQTITTHQITNATTYSLIIDNLDTNVKPRFKRKCYESEQSLHYTHCLAIKDRISQFSELSISPYLTCFNNAEKTALQLLPSKESDSKLMEIMIMMVAHSVVTYMPYFQFSCSDIVDWHKEHQYSKEMNTKSDVVPLGVLMLNENKGDEMIKILQHLQRYIPTKEIEEEVYIPTEQNLIKRSVVLQHKLLLGGDQLTVARTRGAQMAMCNARTADKKLEGFIPTIQDWHSKVVLTEVIWKYFYDVGSGREHGTLYQLRNKINRTDVSKPKSSFNACDDFLEIVVNAHILSAALKILKMSSIEDEPSNSVIGISSSKDLWTYSNDERKAILRLVCEKIVKSFICFSFNDNPNQNNGDEINNYACYFLSIGCFYLAYKDAIKEGDGMRVLECWRYLLPIFHNSGRKNYAKDAFLFLTQYFYDLPPQQSKQFLYSRFVNTRGVKGRNIAADLHQEHLNRLCKDCVKGLGSNKTKENIGRCSKALGVLDQFLSNFDEHNHVPNLTGAHSPPSCKEDLYSIIDELKEAEVFSVVSGRKHQSFKKPKDILHAKTKDEIVTYVSEHLKQKYHI